MISLIIIITLINQYSTQEISGSSSKCLGSVTGCCGSGSDSTTCGKASVLRGQSHIGIPSACFNRVDAGPCSQDLIRIYYDHNTYTCKAFSYSGCGGNANRFVSIKNCYKLCHPYYRQRFISLHSDNSNNNSSSLPGSNLELNGQSPSSESPPEQAVVPNVETTPLIISSQETTTQQITTEETTTQTTTTEETTTQTTTTEEDKGVLYFSSLDGKKIPVKPEIQVVHEYDQFVEPPIGPHMRSIMGQPSQQSGSQHGYLENVQHESYSPQGGYIKTAQGYVPSAQNEQKIVLI